MSFSACLFFLVVVLINNIVLWNQPRNLKNIIKYSFSKHSLQRKMNKTCTYYLDVGSAWDSMKELPFCLQLSRLFCMSLLLRLAVAVRCYPCLLVIVGEQNHLKVLYMSTAGDDTGVSLFSAVLETGKATQVIKKSSAIAQSVITQLSYIQFIYIPKLESVFYAIHLSKVHHLCHLQRLLSVGKVSSNGLSNRM